MPAVNIETAAKNFQTALVDLVGAVLSNGSTTTAPAAATAAGRGPGRPKAVTLEQVKAMGEKVRDTIDKPTAVSLIKAHGANSLGEMDKSRYAEFLAACEVALKKHEDGDGDEGGDEGGDDL